MPEDIALAAAPTIKGSIALANVLRAHRDVNHTSGRTLTGEVDKHTKITKWTVTTNRRSAGTRRKAKS
jgi:hypothetical protein